MRFKNRNVIITGAASGIGRALCELMGNEGASLGLLDRDQIGLQSLEKSLQTLGVRHATAVADVRSRIQVHAAIEQLAAQLGSVDIVIASAGVCGLSGIDDLKVEKLEEIVQVNFLGVVYTLEAVLPDMLRRQTGHIVGIASLAAIGGLPFEGAYCASKAALASYLESLRPPLRRRGITVTTVFPGFVQTPLLHNLVATGGKSAFRGAIEVEKAARTIASAIDRRCRVHYFPRITSRLVRLARWLPRSAYDWVMTRLAARISLPY